MCRISCMVRSGPPPATLRVGLAVDPGGSLAVSLDLHVLGERFGADRSPLVEKSFDLTKNEGVALDRRGVVGFEVPDVRPHVLRFLRCGKAAQARVQLVELRVEACVGRGTAGTTTRHEGST